jgi:hypothetical protein
MIEEFRLQRKIHKKYVENILINVTLYYLSAFFLVIRIKPRSGNRSVSELSIYPIDNTYTYWNLKRLDPATFFGRIFFSIQQLLIAKMRY